MRIFPYRRRRRASAGALVLFLGFFFGIDYVRKETQRSEEWSGTIVRVYKERSFLGGRTSERYWDVRLADGEIRSPRIQLNSVWSASLPGDHVIKKAGELDPFVVTRR